MNTCKFCGRFTTFRCVCQRPSCVPGSRLQNKNILHKTELSSQLHALCFLISSFVDTVFSLIFGPFHHQFHKQNNKTASMAGSFFQPFTFGALFIYLALVTCESNHLQPSKVLLHIDLPYLCLLRCQCVFLIQNINLNFLLALGKSLINYCILN